MTVTLYAGSKKATLRVRASKRYEAGVRYTMPLDVNELVADGSMTVETLSEELPAPGIKVFRKTHGMIVAEFEQSVDTYETQGRTFNIRLLEGDKVLRSYDKYSFKYGGKNGTIYSYLYNRFVFRRFEGCDVVYDSRTGRFRPMDIPTSASKTPRGPTSP